MPSDLDIENESTICRITCGWKKPELPLDVVRRYWRDVHSPAIARRPGINEYRHYQFDPVNCKDFDTVQGINFNCSADTQLMWLSDVRYRNETELAAFSATPEDKIRNQLLGDIDLIVDQSTTYKALGEDAITLIDNTGNPTPQGPPKRPTFEVFFRQKGPSEPFRALLRKLAAIWSTHPQVLRIRLSLLEAPDMLAEKAAGYPIKTHPIELQYQAWIDVVLTGVTGARDLFTSVEGMSEVLSDVHVYPVTMLCTSNYNGKPTFVGLRGYPAWSAINDIGGYNQAQPEIMEWMFGEAGRSAVLTAPNL